MGRIVTLNLDDDIAESLEQKASRRGRSLEEELQAMAATAAYVSPKRSRLTAEERLAIADAICAKSRLPQQTDSVELLREDRDR